MTTLTVILPDLKGECADCRGEEHWLTLPLDVTLLGTPTAFVFEVHSKLVLTGSYEEPKIAVCFCCSLVAWSLQRYGS